MKHDFIDKYSILDSPIHRVDPRAKLPAFFAAVFIMVSEPRGEVEPFALYYIILFLVIALSRIPLKFIISRCLIASPLIIMAVVMLPLSFHISGDGSAAINGDVISLMLSIVLKAFAAIILLTILTSSSRFTELLWALRRLKAPRILNLISGVMYRYLFILTDELHKTKRARECRSPGRLQINRFRVYGNQAAVILMRSWERAERVYAAMVSRGFTGDFPEGASDKFRAIDAGFLFLFTGIFLAVRII